MSYTATAIFSFGASITDVTGTTVQPRDAGNAPVGPPVAGTFTAIALGVFDWTGNVPDAAVSGIAYRAAAPMLVSVRQFKVIAALDEAAQTALQAAADNALAAKAAAEQARDAVGAIEGGGDVDVDAIGAALAARLVGQQVTILSPLYARDSLEIVAGDTYAGSRAIAITIAGYAGPSLDGMAVELRLANLPAYTSAIGRPTAEATGTGVISQAGATLTMALAINGSDTDGLDAGDGENGRIEYKGVLYVPATRHTLAQMVVRVHRAIDPAAV